MKYFEMRRQDNNRNIPLVSLALTTTLLLWTGAASPRDLQVIKPETLSCADCVLYRFDYCQPVSKGLYFTDVKGTCGNSDELNPLPPAAPTFRCSDKYFNNYKDEWLTFLPCPFITAKCGSTTQILTVNKAEKSIDVGELDQGDVCMYELQYDKSLANADYRLWFSSMHLVEVTLVDGLRIHPWLD